MSLLNLLYKKGIPIVLGIGICILLILRVQVASQRFFDVDEFTHMHWAAQIFMGEKPYIDFYTFFPIGYHWIIQPLFYFLSDNAMIFVAGRMFGVLTFAGVLVVLTILFARLRSKWLALLPAYILAFLPMPYDKYFEIRPDTLSTLFGFIGVLLLSIGWGGKQNKRKTRLIFFSAGVMFAICLLVLPKMLPFVMVAGLVVVGKIGIETLKKGRTTVFQTIEPLVFLVFGGFLIAGLFLLWLLSLGDFSTVWYMLMKAGVEGNKIGNYFIMEPHLFFFPNSSFYGGEGLTLSYVVNHALWIIAIIWGTYRLFAPAVTAQNGKTSVVDELLLSGIFFVSVYGYVYFFPLKHTQYLIPIGVFVAFYVSDFVVSIMEKITWKGNIGHVSRIGQMGIICAIVIIGIAVNRELNTRKLFWKNIDQLKEFTLLTQTIPKTAVVVDMEGKMLTWKHGYYVCCLAWGQFGPFLSHPLPSLKESLVKNNVEYIYQGDSGRLPTVLPDDLTYITTHYIPVEHWYGKLLKRK